MNPLNPSLTREEVEMQSALQSAYGKNTLSTIIQSNWISLPETKNVLANLNKQREQIIKDAESLASNPSSDPTFVKNMLVKSNAIKEIIEYVSTNPEAIVSTRG
jgi:hypothetical protein